MHTHASVAVHTAGGCTRLRSCPYIPTLFIIHIDQKIIVCSPGGPASNVCTLRWCQPGGTLKTSGNANDAADECFNSMAAAAQKTGRLIECSLMTVPNQGSMHLTNSSSHCSGGTARRTHSTLPHSAGTLPSPCQPHLAFQSGDCLGRTGCLQHRQPTAAASHYIKYSL